MLIIVVPSIEDAFFLEFLSLEYRFVNKFTVPNLSNANR